MPRHDSRDKNKTRMDIRATALLLLDLISDFDFPDGGQLLRAALPAAQRIGKLRHRAKAAGIPVIYVNDNLGKWQSDRHELLKHCLGEQSKGRPLVQHIAPEVDDYFIFKPKHSGFYATPLAELLQASGTKRLIITGTTSHQCVLFTAMDAYVRDFELVVPRDCIASPSPTETDHALFILREALAARTPMASSLRFRRRRKAQ
jgi:nicotinamidase-related amidase